MSFARTKFTRFNGKSGRPATAATTGLRQTSSSQKSFIPKFRSLSQPPSAHSMKDDSEMDDSPKLSTSKAQIEQPQVITSTHSMKSEEFKDCLDAKSEGIITVLETGIGSVEENAAKEPSKERPNLATRRASSATAKRESVASKNSSSGIPVSVSGKVSIKVSPKPSPRIPRSPNPVVKNQTSSTRSTPPSECKVNQVTPTNKKNLELFLLKKKRFELLKKEIIDKQRPVFELYQSLQQLKKKLEENGKQVVLENLRMIDCEDFVQKTDLSAGGETVSKVETDPDVLSSMKEMVSDIPQGFQDMCKNLMEKRNSLFEMLEKTLDEDVDKEAIKSDIERLRMENEDFDVSLSSAFKDQEEHIKALVAKWSTLAANADERQDTETIKELQSKLKKQENLVKEISSELQVAQQQLKEGATVDASMFEAQIAKLREKTHQLEKQLDSEKKKYQHEVERFKATETSIKSFKTKIKDFDANKQHYETRISQLSQDLRNAQLKIKQLEKNYEKEIAELNKSRHLDKSVIERLNKDKSSFESRLQSVNETAQTTKFEFEEREAQLQKELEEYANETEATHAELSQLRKECELLRKQVNSFEQQAQQANDMMTRKKDRVDKPETDRECELQIEIVAQRAAIRALQEKVEANVAEKLRFIETIEKMNGTPEGMNDAMVKAMVKREEDITKYDLLLKKNEELICKQKVEIDSLHVKQQQLKREIEAMNAEENSEDLKHMLKEGKSKLEQALAKSLENEHKIVKYEHELAQKNQAIANLENMMKVRDGLIGVIKAKKEELSMENHSLTKYSEEIRSYVLESKEELKEKSEIIQELQSTVNAKHKETNRLEKKVLELEEKLTMTNEKRYKLQDTITYMEKELQATKAQMNQFEDMQTRYEIGRITENTSKSKVGLYPWNENSVQLFEHYRQAYKKQQKLKQYKSEMNTIHKNSAYSPNGPSTLDGGSEYTPCKLDENASSAPALTAKSSYDCKAIDSLHGRDDFNFGHAGDSLANNNRVTNTINTMLLDNPENIFGSGKDYKPIVFKGIDRYRVLNKGNILWCQPSYEMQLNNSLITKDLIAHTCSKIKHTIESDFE